MTLGAFGVSAGIFALFFFSDVPRVRKDIIQVLSNQAMRNGYELTSLQKIPIIGDHFVKEIPPSDNVRPSLRLSSLGVFFYFLDHSSSCYPSGS
jgi:hypothetical protein